MNSEEAIKDQRNKVIENDFQVALKEACTLGNGIIQFKDTGVSLLKESDKSIGFFIPASGSGSRMFQFLFAWLEDRVETEEVNQFFEVLPSLALAREINTDGTKEKIVQQLLTNFAEQPKGLLPFHEVDGHAYSAFQEHVLQALEMFPDQLSIEFTIQRDFQAAIEKNIEALGVSKAAISFSYQDEATNAYCFDSNGALVEDNGKILRRPSGHGALLENLNRIDKDVVLVKNIDNIQHQSYSENTILEWRKCLAVLDAFQHELAALQGNYSRGALEKLNAKYQFLSDEELTAFDESNLAVICGRPTRVCGMVVNEGAPGGGPYWIKDTHGVTKQIIEKAQISSDEAQQQIMEGSSHFNPVFLAISKCDVNGNRLDLADFVDHSKYFVVHKSHKGQPIHYRELPGLWNGSMSNWNTIFLEIPSNVFSPVKSILDLIHPLHNR